jgi:V8-like Glu-specific endopeptidase
VRARGGRRSGRHSDLRTPWARRLARSPARAALVAALALGTIIVVTPANGAAGDIAAGFVKAMRNHLDSSRSGQSFAGTAAVGALFTTSGGKLGSHFCSASVVDSPAGDLAITAAHCVTGTSGTIEFVPGYDNGAAPYGVWTVTGVYVDQAWRSSSDPDDDVAFLTVGQSWSSVPVEDVTGAERLGTGPPAARQPVEVIGYPDSSGQAVSCQNSVSRPMEDTLEFDCGGYTNGTSGGPFLVQVSQKTGQGTVIGVIGGYEQGGYTPDVSYSVQFGAKVAALYRTAVSAG